MLGLPGFVLLAVSSAFGELEQAVETTATTAWCEAVVWPLSPTVAALCG